MKQVSKFIYALIILIFDSYVTQAQPEKGTGGQAISNNESIPLDPQVKMGKLANGFTYYIRKNREPENRVVLYLVNKVGSMQETEEQRGLAHFLEHMCFNGTKNFPKHELLNYLQKSGVRFGADLNAYTGFDETVYQLPIAANNPELFKNALLVMRDWAHDVTLDAGEIDKERGVVLEERRGRLGAQQRILDKMMPVLFNNSLYADRIPIGSEEVLKTFPYETLRKFYSDWYRPDLQALVVVGDINVKTVEKMIIEKFSDLKNPQPEKPRTEYLIPLLNKNQFQVITDAESPGTRIEIHLKQQVTPFITWADYNKRLLRSILNDLLASRFNEISQRENVPCTEIDARLSALISNIDEFILSVQPKPGETEQALRLLITEAERIKRYGFTKAELERSKANILTQLESAYKERASTPSDRYVNEYVQHFLKNEPSPGIEQEYNFLTKNLETFTVESVNLLCNQFIPLLLSGDSNRDIFVIANEKDKSALPSGDTINQLIKETSEANVEAYVDKSTDKTLLSEKPAPGKIISERVLEKINVTELVLSNGIKVLLKPTSFKKDQILFSATSPGGTSLVNDDDFIAASLLPPVIVASGVGNFSATALGKWMAGKNVFVAPAMTPLHEGFNGSTSPKDLETALQLVNLYFTKPRKDLVAFNTFIEKTAIELTNTGNIPEAVFQDTIEAVSSGYHLRTIKPTPVQLKAITLEKVMSIYRDRFADASDFTFVFVGNFEINSIKPLLELYLGSLPALNRKEQWKDVKQDLVTGLISRKVYKGLDQKARVSLIFSGDIEFNQTEQLRINTLCEVLQLRLVDRLREEESGIYNVQVLPQVLKYPSGKYNVTINFACDPGNVELLILATHTELGKLRMDGAIPEDMQAINAQHKIGIEQGFRSNDFWISTLTKKIQNDGVPEEIAELKSIVLKIKSGDINEAANKYLSGTNYMRFVLLPEEELK
jgi:zinc protease